MIRTALVLLFLCCAGAAAEPAPGTIAVGGSARVLVAPDEVAVALAAEAVEKDLAKAKAATDAGIAAVRAAARDLGVPDERVQTDAVDIGVSWHTPGSLPAYGSENRYFKVRRGIVVVLGSADQLDALLSRALAGGITSVDGITFRSTRLAELRAAARLQAVKAAREKAAAMAEALGAGLGRPLSIAEQDSRWRWGGWNGRRGGMPMQNVQLQFDGGGQAASGDGGIAPGQIAIEAEVTVSFLFADAVR